MISSRCRTEDTRADAPRTRGSPGQGGGPGSTPHGSSEDGLRAPPTADRRPPRADRRGPVPGGFPSGLTGRGSDGQPGGGAQVSPTATFQADLGLDSLDTVELVMAIEEEFAIEIPDAEADKILSCGDAIAYLSAHPQAA